MSGRAIATGGDGAGTWKIQIFQPAHVWEGYSDILLYAWQNSCQHFQPAHVWEGYSDCKPNPVPSVVRGFQPAHVWEGYSDSRSFALLNHSRISFNPPMSGRAIATATLSIVAESVAILSTRPCLGGL